MAEHVMGTPATTGDDAQLTTTRLYEHAARSFGRQEVVHRDQAGQWHTTTYAATWRRVRSVAAGLQAAGVGPGDRVGLMMWNDLRHYESYFAVPAVGATMIQLNLRLSPADLAYVVEHSGLTRIVVDATLLELAVALAPRVPQVRQWIVAADEDMPLDGAHLDVLGEVLRYEDLAATDATDLRLPDMDERSASAACYTTGTTGRPKGVFYSHRSVWLHATAVVGMTPLGVRDSILMLTPMFHVQCWGLPFAAALVGARVVLPGRFTLQDTGAIAEWITQHGVTRAPAAPAILDPLRHWLLQQENPPRWEGLRLTCGASEPSTTLMEDVHRLTGARIVHAYGATETSPLVTLNNPVPAAVAGLDEDAVWDLERRQGLVAPGVDVKIAGPGGEALPFDGASVGEVCLRGPWITASYHENPEANASSFDEDGYWRSGDVGTVDEQGYLKITDRLKDVIKSGGEWISSVDMESALAAMPEVREVAVVGVPHPKWEERPLVIAVPADGAEITLEKVHAALTPAFASWQLPDQVRVVEEIARTSVGKINKRRLRDDFGGAYTG
ncbi:long-chain-fatty-acid--CoA ligase [Micrococcus endophyticus]|uniref:long-chain-fatty-acid--CoA ligase n=1 Tax=Micrococcus endophyticus TaxID=455343 RepID=UPI0034CDDCDB